MEERGEPEGGLLTHVLSLVSSSPPQPEGYREFILPVLKLFMGQILLINNNKILSKVVFCGLVLHHSKRDLECLWNSNSIPEFELR